MTAKVTKFALDTAIKDMKNIADSGKTNIHIPTSEQKINIAMAIINVTVFNDDYLCSTNIYLFIHLANGSRSHRWLVSIILKGVKYFHSNTIQSHCKK